MIHQEPTPPAPAEVCERLKQLHRSLGSTSQDGYKNDRATLTAALLLIEQGEQERERLEEQVEWAVSVRDAAQERADRRAVDQKEYDQLLPKAQEELLLTRAQLAAATERVTALEQDKERLDWLEKQRSLLFGYPVGKADTYRELMNDLELGAPETRALKVGLGGRGGTFVARNFRAAIDAARAQPTPESK